MEVFAAFNKVTNYQDFLLFTDKIKSPNSLDYSNVPLNILSLRNLKNIIEFERRASIQDLGKNFIQSNIAVFVTSTILKSKVQCVWEDISGPVVTLIECALIQYVKSINIDFDRWWGSLSVVISSISELCSKHTSLQDLILSKLSNIILSLACDKSLPLDAVKYVVKNFNICSLNSKRQLRMKLCLSLQDYFSQIAKSIATCGDFDCQHAYFQTLLRWLVRRSDKEVRVAAAQRWFPTALFPHEARQIFVERKFEHFDLDCRDFMNAVNRFSGLVTSIDAVSIYMGQIKLKEIDQNKRIFLDINSGSISIYCDATSFCNPEPKNFQHASQWETIIVIPDIVNEAQLKREGNEPVLKLHLEREPEYQLPTSKTMVLENYKTLDVQFDKSEVLKKASAALQRLFGVKYQVQQNVMHLIHTPDKNQTHNASKCFIGTNRSANVSAVLLHSNENRPSPLCTSSSRVCQKRSSSLSVKISRQHQSAGLKVSRILMKKTIRRDLAPCGTSPSLASSTSTASLARLGENLKKYQQVNYDKRMDYLAQSPSLSNITEETNLNALSVQSSYNNLLAKQTDNARAKFPSTKLDHIPNNGNEKNNVISPVSSGDENFRSLLSFVVEQNAFDTHADTLFEETQTLRGDLLEEAMSQNPVVRLTKLSERDIEEEIKEITAKGSDINRSEAGKNVNGMREQIERQTSMEREINATRDFEETGSDVILETQIHRTDAVKKNVGERVKPTSSARQLIKQACFVENKSDDSIANDFIEATPLINKSKHLGQRKKINSKSEPPRRQYVSEEAVDSLTIIDKNVVEEFFESHFSQGNETIHVSPETARIVNETTSDSDQSEHSESPLANEIMERVKECLASIITKISEAELKTYREKKTDKSQHTMSSQITQINTPDRAVSKHKVGKITEKKDTTNIDVKKKLTKLNDPGTPIITNKRRKLYSPGDIFQCEENSNNKVSQNDNLPKVNPPNIYGGSASEDCRGKKSIRKKYLMSGSDEQYKSVNKEKHKAPRTKLRKDPHQSREIVSDHSLLASKFRNFIQTANRDKETVYNYSSDVDDFEYKKKKVKNTKKKRNELKNRNRDEVRTNKIPTKHGRLVKACNYAESDTTTSANDSSLSRDNSRPRFGKSLSLKHRNDILIDEKMRKDSNNCPDTELNRTMDDINLKNKTQDDNDLIPKLMENEISMVEQLDQEVDDNIFSIVTSPKLKSAPCVENVQIENTARVTLSKLPANKSRITKERAKSKAKTINKESYIKDLNETSESLPPLIVEAVCNKRNDCKLDIKSLSIDKIKIALSRPAETTLDDLQSDIVAMSDENTCEVVNSDPLIESHGDIPHESETAGKEREENNNCSMVTEIQAVADKVENEQSNFNNNAGIEISDNTVNHGEVVNIDPLIESHGDIPHESETAGKEREENNNCSMVTEIQAVADKVENEQSNFNNNAVIEISDNTVNHEEVVNNDPLIESHAVIPHESETAGKEREENNICLMVTEIQAVADKVENEQSNFNNNAGIEIGDNMVNHEVPTNTQIEADYNLQKPTENIVEKDSTDQIQEIITVVDSSENNKQTKTEINSCLSEKQIERFANINEPISTTIIIDISDDENSSMNNTGDVSCNTLGESPIRAHVDTINDLPVSLTELQRTPSPRQRIVRSDHVSPKLVSGQKVGTKRLLTSTRFFSGSSLWSGSSDSSDGDCGMYMKKKPNLRTPSTKQNVNKRITLFCNTPGKSNKHDGTKLTENSSGLLCNLSALTAHMSPIKYSFGGNDTNLNTRNEVLKIQASQQVTRKKKRATLPEENTSDICNNDLWYRPASLQCHISPLKLPPLLSSDVDSSSTSADERVSPPIKRKGKVTVQLDRDGRREATANCNNEMNNSMEINLPRESRAQHPDDSDTEIQAVADKVENEQSNFNDNAGIEIGDNTVNHEVPTNTQIEADYNLQKPTENIVEKDSTDQIQAIITIVDSSENNKQTNTEINSCLSEKQIERFGNINEPNSTTIIIDISDDENSSMNNTGDVSCNTLGESPIRAHVDTINDLPVSLTELQRTPSPRQRIVRSDHVSPKLVSGQKVGTKRLLTSTRFFSGSSLWSGSSDSSDGDCGMYMKKKPNLRTPSTKQNVNKRITLFCNTPGKSNKHDGTKLTENSSGLLCNLSALTAHMSPIKYSFGGNDTNLNTRNEVLKIQASQQVTRKKKRATLPEENTSDICNNDLWYRPASLQCHISPLKLPPLLSSDVDSSSTSADERVSPPIKRKGKVTVQLDRDGRREATANCNNEMNNSMEINLPRESRAQHPDDSDTEIQAVADKVENEQSNFNDNAGIEIGDNTVNHEVPTNTQIEADYNLQKPTENIVEKDSTDQIQAIITIVDSSENNKQTNTEINSCLSEKQIERFGNINEPNSTTIIIDISDDENSSMNNTGDVSCNTLGESPIRAHVDTINDLPVSLTELQRTPSPRQRIVRSDHVSPELVSGQKVGTKRLLTSTRFFSGSSLWSGSSVSSDGDCGMYMKKKPNLRTPSTKQNINKRITLFCNTPEKSNKHDGKKLTENSSGLLCNLSALTAHMSPIKYSFGGNDTNLNTRNEVLKIQVAQQVTRKKKSATLPEENTSDNCNNDLWYRPASLQCHISPMKLPPLLSSDADLSSTSADERVSSPIKRKGKVTVQLERDGRREATANCNNEMNNSMEINLPRESRAQRPDDSDTDLSMRSATRSEPTLQPDLRKADLKSRWESFEAQLAQNNETDVQLECRVEAFKNCLSETIMFFSEIIKLKEQQTLQNAKIKEDALEIRKLISEVLDT